MYNSQIVSSFLRETGMYPEGEGTKNSGLYLSLEDGRLLLRGTPEDLIDLADLLVSLAMSGAARGQHWHIDDLNLMDASSEVAELILLQK